MGVLTLAGTVEKCMKPQLVPFINPLARPPRQTRGVRNILNLHVSHEYLIFDLKETRVHINTRRRGLRCNLYSGPQGCLLTNEGGMMFRNGDENSTG